MYLALPRQVVLLVPAAVEGDQEVGARVAVGEGQAGGAHLLARGLWREVSQVPVCVAVQWLVVGANWGRHALWSLRPTAFLIVSVTVMVAAGVGVWALQWRGAGGSEMLG